jgi:VanZ family protein
MISAFRPNIWRPARIVAWTLATAIAALSVIPPSLRPETGVPHDIEPFLIYAATGLAFGLGYDRKRGSIVILLLIFTSAVEIAQLFVPGRHARLSDFMVDAFAILAGFMIVPLASRIRGRLDFQA